MAQPSGKMSHSVGGGAGVLEGMGRRGMISQTHDYLGAGRREHEPVLPSGRATPPSPPPAPRSRVRHQHLEGIGIGDGDGNPGSGGGMGEQHPPIAPHQSRSCTCTALRHNRLSLPSVGPHHLTPVSDLRGERCRSCRAPGRGDAL